MRTEVSAQAPTSSYGQLQAAYLYNFAKYIKWPEETPAFVIGVFGESEIMDDIEGTLKGKRIGGKAIVVMKIITDEQVLECKIVYLPETSSRDLSILQEKISGKSILIVTEEDLIRRGAMISFVVEDDKLRFKLSKAALIRSNLVASEGLLRLAIVL